MNKKTLLLNTLSGGIYKQKPVWFMRQAGRFLKSYRNMREKYDFLTMCTTPDLAAKITISPLKELDVDAMILFSDILIPLKALGAELHYKNGTSPIVGNLDITAENYRQYDLDAVSFVKETIQNIKGEVKDAGLIGFGAAPFTLGCYIFGAGGDFYKIRSFIYEQPRIFERIMSNLTDLTIDYLKLQVEAGADAIQLFDSWAGILPKNIYEKSIYPFNKKIAENLDVPSIYYAKNSAHINDIMVNLGFDCLSVDWRQNLTDIYNKSKKCVQGNMDNTLLLISDKTILKLKTENILSQTKDISHIFNLGHGVLPQTNTDMAKLVIDTVHNI